MDYRLILARFYYYVLTRRYRVKIKGMEILKSSETKLFLPNHQSYIDPQLIAVITALHSDFVPVVSDTFLKIPVISYFLKKWNTIPVGEPGSKRETADLKKIFLQVINTLKRKKNVILYPSGKITITPIEKIHNKQSAFVVVSQLPEEVRVIGVRISGLWGSMWSVAWMGERPDFVLTYFKGIIYFFANFIFFIPKRNVTFEYVDITAEAKLKAMKDRRTFNNYLEDFYNNNGPEKATYIKHLFYFPKSKRKYPGNLMKP